MSRICVTGANKVTHKIAFLGATSPSLRKSTLKLTLCATTYKVTFVSNGVEKTVDCRDDEYLLDAADDNGVDLPASCRGGLCGTCVSKLVSGEVDQSWLRELDDGNVLTSEQMAAGFILPCSVKPKSDLKVAYDYSWGLGVLENWCRTSSA